MGEEADDGGHVSVHSVDRPWTPTHSRTWGNDAVGTRSKGWSLTWTWGFRNEWSSARRTTKQALTSTIHCVKRTMKPVLSAIRSTCHHDPWLFILRVLKAKKQWSALFLFIFGAVVPMILLGYFTSTAFQDYGVLALYYMVFATKTMGCGNMDIDFYPANSRIVGIEGLFVLDTTMGRFAFSTVKIIDVAWDIIFARGVQLLAWWAAYIVFSDALLRVIERHPASFRIFQRIALEGPSLHSLWTLCKELLSVNSKRTKILFAYMLLSTSYVLCIPMFLGAMTGYESTAIAWIDVDNSNNMIPVTALERSWVITGTTNSKFDRKVCSDPSNGYAQSQYLQPRPQHCSCLMPNGTVAPANTFSYTGSLTLSDRGSSLPEGTTCLFNYEGSNETWDESTWNWSAVGQETKTYKCNETVMVEIDEKMYDIQTVNGKPDFCYENEAYEQYALQGKSRCLPDTANPSYQWGFSTMLSGIFVFTHFGWCVSMYIVWLDAQSRSTLVREGYEMTPLRAAFAIAKAVRNRTGLRERRLLRHDTKDLNKELYGTSKQKGTKIEYSMFVTEAWENPGVAEGIRRRTTEDELPS